MLAITLRPAASPKSHLTRTYVSYARTADRYIYIYIYVFINVFVNGTPETVLQRLKTTYTHTHAKPYKINKHKKGHAFDLKTFFARKRIYHYANRI